MREARAMRGRPADRLLLRPYNSDGAPAHANALEPRHPRQNRQNTQTAVRCEDPNAHVSGESEDRRAESVHDLRFALHDHALMAVAGVLRRTAQAHGLPGDSPYY